MEKRVNYLPLIILLMTLKKKRFQNIVGKEENSGNQHFLLCPQYFLSYPEKKLSFGSP